MAMSKSSSSDAAAVSSHPVRQGPREEAVLIGRLRKWQSRQDTPHLQRPQPGCNESGGYCNGQPLGHHQSRLSLKGPVTSLQDTRAVKLSRDLEVSFYSCGS